MDLKEQVVYQLPNGRDLVARFAAGNSIFLGSLSASDEIHYEVNTEGRLFAHGRLTGWSVNDLSDTTRMLSPEATAQVFARMT